MDVFKLVGSIFIKNDEANQQIDETTGKAESASGKLGKAFGVMAKGVTVAVGSCATAVGVITKQAVSAYADYEQLVGGVETLFKESANIVQSYAHGAFESAGLSANEYMETVTSFSASLLQSLEGDTALSADYANRAIVDMADNANKMGTDIGMIQNAYQGFAKQNYTMLDNLKLGYGGTKEEMARLVAKASKMTETQEKLGITVDENSLSFGNIVNAISVVQDKMGIAGATASEANTTISGSLSMLKASWKNTLVAMGDDTANFDEVIGKLVDSASIAFTNLLPRIEIVFKAIPDLITKLAPQIPVFVQSLLPSLLNSAINLFNGLVAQIPSLIRIVGSAISSNAPLLFSSIADMLVGIADYLQTNLPIFTEKAKEMVGGLGDKIKENLPEVISKGLDILLGLSQTMLENIPVLVEVGMDFIKSIVEGIVGAFPELIAKAPEIITNFADTINQSFPILLLKGAEIIWEIIAGIIESIPDLIANFWSIIEAIIAVWSAINWLNLGKNLMNGIKEGIEGMGGTLMTKVTSIFNSIKDAILHPMRTAKSLVDDVLNAIKSKFSSIFESAKTIVKSGLDKITSFFKAISWTLPKIKLPHFSISGKFSLNPPSVPKFSIAWYKKAMDNAMILNNPTIFGYGGGKFLGGGEAGSEVVAGSQTLMGMIQDAVSVQNSVLAEVLYKILDAIITMDENMGGNMREALSGTALEVNKREFARLVKVVT